MTEIHITDPTPFDDDIILEQSLRPSKFDEFIGQKDLVDNLKLYIEAANKRGESLDHVLLFGPPGLGKTTLANIISKEIGANLKQTSGPLLQIPGDLAAILSNLKENEVLFIDEIHTLVGAGGSEGSIDAANILKPALARGDLRAIGATTLDEYQKYIEKDKALERRFQKVNVNEPNTESTVSILRGIKEKYEMHHKVRIKDDAIIGAVSLSNRYIRNRFLPDKAIDLIDEAASKLKMEMNSKPEELDILDRRICLLYTSDAADE